MVVTNFLIDGIDQAVTNLLSETANNIINSLTSAYEEVLNRNLLPYFIITDALIVVFGTVIIIGQLMMWSRLQEIRTIQRMEDYADDRFARLGH